MLIQAFNDFFNTIGEIMHDVVHGKEKQEKKSDLKYELDKNDMKSITIEDRNFYLYRLVALKDFSDVKAGSKGGYISEDVVLEQTGDCWVYDDSMVCGNVRIRSNAKIFNSSVICKHIYGIDENPSTIRLLDDTTIHDTKITTNKDGDDIILTGFTSVHNSNLFGGDIRINGDVIIDSSLFNINNAEINIHVAQKGHIIHTVMKNNVFIACENIELVRCVFHSEIKITLPGFIGNRLCVGDEMAAITQTSVIGSFDIDLPYLTQTDTLILSQSAHINMIGDVQTGSIKYYLDLEHLTKTKTTGILGVSHLIRSGDEKFILSEVGREGYSTHEFLYYVELFKEYYMKPRMEKISTADKTIEKPTGSSAAAGGASFNINSSGCTSSIFNLGYDHKININGIIDDEKRPDSK